MDCSPKKWPLLEGSTSLQGPVTIDNFCCGIVSSKLSSDTGKWKIVRYFNTSEKKFGTK